MFAIPAQLDAAGWKRTSLTVWSPRRTSRRAVACRRSVWSGRGRICANGGCMIWDDLSNRPAWTIIEPGHRIEPPGQDGNAYRKSRYLIDKHSARRTLAGPPPHRKDRRLAVFARRDRAGLYGNAPRAASHATYWWRRAWAIPLVTSQKA